MENKKYFPLQDKKDFNLDRYVVKLCRTSLKDFLLNKIYFLYNMFHLPTRTHREAKKRSRSRSYRGTAKRSRKESRKESRAPVEDDEEGHLIFSKGRRRLKPNI